VDEPTAKRILVVDDEQCIAHTLALILRAFGYDAAAINDAQTALHECQLRVPDLVLSDVVMPEMNGIELAIQIEQRYPSCRILLISGLGTSFEMAAEASRNGHNFEILSKPIRPDVLLARIKAALADGILSQDSQDRAAADKRFPVLSSGRQSEIKIRETGT
jgi:DNA-binding NtrC family response regulator